MSNRRLTRELGVFSATMLGLGSILGTGIFVSIGIAAGVAGPAVILAIGLAAVLATPPGGTGTSARHRLVQRFGSALNLNIHFHLLVADGVWQQTSTGPEFRRVPPPTREQLERLLATLTRRAARHLVRRGWLSEDAEGASPTGEGLGDSGLGTLRAHSITSRIVVGPNAGRKALTLRTLPGGDPDESPAGLRPTHTGVQRADNAGISISTRKPAPSRFLAVTVPPWRRMLRSAIASPMPPEPDCVPLASPTRKNGSKI